jgi:hypothetical protein
MIYVKSSFLSGINCLVRSHAERSVTLSRDGQGLGFTADAARYCALFQRSPGPQGRPFLDSHNKI